MAIKNINLCPYCNFKHSKKDAISDGAQRYKCNDCNNRLRSKRRPLKLQKVIFYAYICRRQTLQDLATEYKWSII